MYGTTNPSSSSLPLLRMVATTMDRYSNIILWESSSWGNNRLWKHLFSKLIFFMSSVHFPFLTGCIIKWGHLIQTLSNPLSRNIWAPCHLLYAGLCSPNWADVPSICTLRHIEIKTADDCWARTAPDLAQIRFGVGYRAGKSCNGGCGASPHWLISTVTQTGRATNQVISW